MQNKTDKKKSVFGIEVTYQPNKGLDWKFSTNTMNNWDTFSLFDNMIKYARKMPFLNFKIVYPWSLNDNVQTFLKNINFQGTENKIF